MKILNFITYTRNFIFGAEDSLVSTVGLLTGISVGGLSRNQIILTGITLILVEAFSMGVGSYLSEYTTEEAYLKDSLAFKNSLVSSVIMFISYTVFGLIPLIPFFIIQDKFNATVISIILTIAALFILGVISSRLLKLKLMQISLRMTVLGGIAIAIGLLVGKMFGG